MKFQIFGAEVLELEGAKPKAALVTFGVTVAIILLAELGVRVALSSIGTASRYWEFDAATKFEKYHAMLKSNELPEVVIVGDSTSARGLNPEFIPGSYNLGWAANFPRAFTCTTFPLLSEPYPVPKMVIASLSPYGFREHPNTARLEANLLSSPYCRALRGEFVFSDYVSLARLSQITSMLFYGPKKMTPLGFLPSTERAAAADSPPSKNKKIPQNVLSEARFEIMTELVRLSKARGFRLVVVVPPRSDHEFTIQQPLFQSYIQRLQALEQQGALTLLDMEEAPFLGPEHFRDPGHLIEEGANILSREVAKRLSLPLQ